MDDNELKNAPDKKETNPSDTGNASQPGIRQQTESAWAERLGLDYDPTPPPIPGSQTPPPVPPQGSEPQQVPESQQSQPTGPQPPMPPTYMLWAVLSTLCCCMPAGIVAIVLAASVSTKYYAGDYEGAARASRRVEIWVIVSIVLGILVNSLYTPLMLLMP